MGIYQEFIAHSRQSVVKKAYNAAARAIFDIQGLPSSEAEISRLAGALEHYTQYNSVVLMAMSPPPGGEIYREWMQLREESNDFSVRIAQFLKRADPKAITPANLRDRLNLAYDKKRREAEVAAAVNRLTGRAR